jgi:hypothetical protein
MYYNFKQLRMGHVEHMGGMGNVYKVVEEI